MEAPTRPINKTALAFKEGSNVIGLAGAIALAAALVSPLPILGALVAEAVYLLFVPDSKWYDRRLAQKYDDEVIARREELKAKILRTLSTDLQSRFSRLENLRGGIAGESFEGKRWYREVVRKMDYLMEKFLLFGSKQVEFAHYIESLRNELGAGVKMPPRIRSGSRLIDEIHDEDGWVNGAVTAIQDAYKKEIEAIEQSLTSDQNLHNQAILNKRHEVLDRRQQYVTQIGEILLNIGHQLRLIEDTFGLINDEIRARSPDQVLADIDDVVFQTDNLTETLQEIAPFDVVTA